MFFFTLGKNCLLKASLGNQNGFSMALLWKNPFVTFNFKNVPQIFLQNQCRWMCLHLQYKFETLSDKAILHYGGTIQCIQVSLLFVYSPVCVFHCIIDHGWHGLFGRMLQRRRGLCWVRRTCRWARSVEFCLPLCGGLSFATEDQILKASPPPMDRKSVTSCPIQPMYTNTEIII